MPDFLYENDLWNEGYRLVGGMDEVGRGAFAGPLVTGVVVFKEEVKSEVLIDDSKKLSPKERKIADLWIRNNSLSYGIGSASVAQINKFGIKKATEIAFRKAIKNCNLRLDYLLIDAFYVPYVKGLRRALQKPIVRGDSVSMSIAAASIIAKVHRDKLMLSLSKIPKYKVYAWGRNKGYGTKEHQDALKSSGKTRLHRVSFLLKLS